MDFIVPHIRAMQMSSAALHFSFEGIYVEFCLGFHDPSILIAFISIFTPNTSWLLLLGPLLFPVRHSDPNYRELV